MKSKLTKIKELLWEECKRIIRATYQNKDGTWECYTCGTLITSKQDAHTGHFIAKSVCGTFLKYDLRNLRVQCMACNVWHGGNGAIFYKNMVEREGQEYVDLIFKDKQRITKESEFLPGLLDEYKKL